MKRGEIWIVNMEPAVGTEIKKIRPVVIIQNDKGIKNSPRTVVAPITSQNTEHVYSVEVLMRPEGTGLKKTSKVLCNQLRRVDKKRLMERIGTTDFATRNALNYALKVTLDLY